MKRSRNCQGRRMRQYSMQALSLPGFDSRPLTSELSSIMPMARLMFSRCKSLYLPLEMRRVSWKVDSLTRRICTSSGASALFFFRLEAAEALQPPGMGRLLTAAAVAAVASCLRDILRCGLVTVVRAAGRKA